MKTCARNLGIFPDSREKRMIETRLSAGQRRGGQLLWSCNAAPRGEGVGKA